MSAHYVSRARGFTALTAALTFAIMACRDNVSSKDGARWGDDAEMTAPADVANAATRSYDRLKSRNKHEWVGAAHTVMMNEFRSELRRPGLLTNNICEYVTTFSMDKQRIPIGRPASPDENWRALRAVADSSSLCSSDRRVRLTSLGFFAPHSILAPPPPQSPSSEAVSLYGEIESAIFLSTDVRDLANRLTPVLDRAASLPELEQAVLGATVSVALNSYSYWAEQYPLFEQEVIAEYSPCIEEQLSLGMSDGITDRCFTGAGAGGAVVTRQELSGKQRLVRMKSRRACGPGLREGFRRIGAADAKGAFTGAFAGGLALGVQGAVAGALAGGGGNSIWAAGENAWQTLKCMYGMT